MGAEAGLKSTCGSYLIDARFWIEVQDYSV
jgi:hypothetical protein